MNEAPAELPPRGRWYRTLKARLLMAAALLIAASVCITTLVVLDRVQRRSEQTLLDQERDGAERMARLLAQRVVLLQQVLRASATAMPAAARQDAAAASDFLRASPALTALFSESFIADASGALIAWHDGTTSVQPAPDGERRDTVQRTLTLGVPLVSPPRVERLSPHPALQITMPVVGEEGRAVAVLGGTLRLGAHGFFDDLARTGDGSGQAVRTIVTDARGVILAHPERDRVLQPIESEPGLAAAAARWVAQGRPLQPSGLASHDGAHFVTRAGVPGADWMVFRIAPDGEPSGGLVQARREAIAWAGGVALLGGSILLGLMAWLLGPLTRLHRRALELHGSERSIDAGWPQAGGEIGGLARVLQRVLRERALGEQRRQLLLQQMNAVLAAAPIGIGFTRERRFELAGAEFCRLLGWQEGTLTGRSAHEIFSSADDYAALGAGVRAAFEAGEPYCGEMAFRRRDGSSFRGRLQGRPVAPGDPGAGTIWLLEDVTDGHQPRERLAWSASHDALTRLLNLGAFEDRLQAWLAQASSGVPAALLFVDLDCFEQVCDLAGDAAGDGLLREVAHVLQAQVRESDAVARLGGEGFGLLLEGCVAAVALQLAERLRAALGAVGVSHAGRRLDVDASIGVVEIDGAAGLAAEAWLARAGAACHEARHAGRGRVRLAGAHTGTQATAPTDA